MPGQSAFGGRWWMWSMVLTIATIALTFAVLSIAPRPVITAWLATNAECKGGHADDPKTLKACEMRDQISARLKRRGCLYQEEGDWWKCPTH